ncbi:MAG TPA: acetoacetate--CoA ligase [Ramlibacter sp.]|jgi:acetoacetyl-CoA synthetase|uniref:acetoacetate--CoA ligase n=1 Tax=Ramlibacter sp. TaxID=1917967 RepID=UPI002D6FF7EB|nr:acetoacetate--CoA ligase [Ramlibacter sp.]HZY20231.1 acetoacetate--CoA ligase [Ramlibacter sp.]
MAELVVGPARAASEGKAGTPPREPADEGSEGHAREAPPPAPASQLSQFTRALAAQEQRGFTDFAALHAHSVRHFRRFWRAVVDWAGDSLGLVGEPEPVCVGDDCEHARFFPGLRLNYADSLLNLRVADADAPALTSVHADGRRVRWRRGELRDAVKRLAQSFHALGLRVGDRVAAVLRNDGQAVLAGLAVAAVGATLSTASPDMGVEALIDRFAPLAPRVLVAHAAPQPFDSGPALPEKLDALCRALPSLQAVVLIDGELAAATCAVERMDRLLADGDADAFAFEPFPFDHPLFVMFSSGTTGRPKCIVHGAGGTLLEHVKEHRLHTDLRPEDRLYFHTSCSWMMWNWQLSALASGAEIVTWDGPIPTVDRLWRLAADEAVTVFGTSPPYLRMSQEAGLVPGSQFDLRRLRAILSTGSVLHDRQYDWVAQAVGPQPLQSISGGTDIIGCFVLGHPDLPVHPGEAQCRSLGLDVQAWDHGSPVDGIGQLVCANPFPSRPLGLFGDTDGACFHAAYFAQNPGVWSHGDLIEFSPAGGARLHGRVDGVLNVRGIKVSPGEIERVLHTMPGVREAMVVEHQSPAREAVTVALVVVAEGVDTGAAFVARVRREVAGRLSAAHVPDRVLEVPALPVTQNGKLSHAAARAALAGGAPANLSALRNPESIDAIRRHAQLQTAAASAAAGTQPLERELEASWAELFGLTAVRPEDDFFELGGNSLMAARLMARVKAVSGLELPLSALLQAPTLGQLAQLVRSRPDAMSQGPAVRLRDGAGPALFLVHGLSGTVLECRALVQALCTSRPVYGFQALGVDGTQPPQGDVRDIAATYVQALRTVQPQGPYAVCGYSFGGLVALEIARALAQAGETLELVALLDTYVHQDLAPLARALSRGRRGWRTVAALPAREWPAYVAGAARRLAGRGAESPATGLQPPTGLSDAQRAVYDTLLQALAQYRPEPFAGAPVTYLRARMPLGGYDDPLPVWRRIARSGLDVVRVSGGHLDLMGPQVRGVAAALDAALQRADALAAAAHRLPSDRRSGIART